MGKLIGGILLIVGTSIGAGILALPVTTAEAGFISSSILLFICWCLMTFSALLILEVNLWLPIEANMISMAKKTLGIPGEIVAWVTYLGLLYALLGAYMSGGSDIFNTLLGFAGVHIPTWLGTLLFTGLLGSIVYLGTRTIDYTNRLLMFIKLSSFVLLLILVLGHVNIQYIDASHPSKLLASVMVMITSFGFATIVPSLRIYFQSDAKKLRQVILIGSLVPLICYILWDLAILGSLPVEGKHGLQEVSQSGHAASSLMILLQQILNNQLINHISKLFTSICVATSFLGVSLCLSDFLADGFKIEKIGFGRIKIQALTFIPPLTMVLFYPDAFLKALNYAGTFASILLTLLPVLMIWRGRYYLGLSGPYRVTGGKITIVIAMIGAILAVSIGCSQEFHLLTF
jgi:tyrosine-specific transport protein